MWKRNVLDRNQIKHTKIFIGSIVGEEDYKICKHYLNKNEWIRIS